MTSVSFMQLFLLFIAAFVLGAYASTKVIVFALNQSTDLKKKLITAILRHPVYRALVIRTIADEVKDDPKYRDMMRKLMKMDL